MERAEEKKSELRRCRLDREDRERERTEVVEKGKETQWTDIKERVPILKLHSLATIPYMGRRTLQDHFQIDSYEKQIFMKNCTEVTVYSDLVSELKSIDVFTQYSIRLLTDDATSIISNMKPTSLNVLYFCANLLYELNLLQRKAYFQYDLIEPNTTSSELWKNLKVIGLGRASEQADIPIPLDRLNEHFVNNPTINNTTKQDTVLPDSVPPTRDKLYFTDVKPIDAMKAIRRINTKAQGPDNISIILIQKIQDIVIPTITHIFNSSLITSTFPKIWKQASVLPLPKVKVPTDPNDYRPISIQPAISKALERIVHRQITNYMNEHKVFDKYQSGFRAGHNTSTALLKVNEDIREAIDSNKITILTLLDLSKAFNAVNFDLLTHKLRNLYLSETAVSWFESYLRERQQCVVSGNRSSSWLDITSGIPQGSVLGPLLFTIYDNDITSLVRHCNYHLYADDLQCYISSRSDRLNDAIDKLNEDIDSSVTWTKKLHLKINPGKTQAIILGHKRQTDAVKHLDISPVNFYLFIYFILLGYFTTLYQHLGYLASE
ncbi:hypothetical protein ANN_14246 [Periplaneta americana]|uniref:Reverse transcriptase domain-containing protein n=1 Tax=Periplaneta americana TaxID=6978 RepID=A0ABQ8SX96_PERAM|nr:hypothetical protein ANN_14246 [Periplaneta americana]